MAERIIHLEADPVHDESHLYGLDFTFTSEDGDMTDFSTYRSFRGRLRVGGLLMETEDVEGVRVKYGAMQMFPRGEDQYVSGEFVMQTFTREALELKAVRAIEKLELKISMASIGDNKTTQ